MSDTNSEEEQDVQSGTESCPYCGEDCICDEVAIQYEPMQTDDAAVDHSVWTALGKVLA